MDPRELAKQFLAKHPNIGERLTQMFRRIREAEAAERENHSLGFKAIVLAEEEVIERKKKE